jgi:hypothetical protein
MGETVKYTVMEEFFRWRWVIRKNVSKRTAQKLRLWREI